MGPSERLPSAVHRGATLLKVERGGTLIPNLTVGAAFAAGGAAATAVCLK